MARNADGARPIGPRGATAPRPEKRARILFAAAALLAAGCLAMSTSEDPSRALRERMVDRQIAGRGVHDPRVLAAMREVPRHRFVPEPLRAAAYEDGPLPIGEGQTISQPFVVASMCEHMALKSSDRVLEIGTGSGYHAAVLSRLAAQVYSIEIVAPLADLARRTLADLGYANVKVRTGDGYRGWPEEAPFDAVILTAAPPEIPEPLVAQLKPGGRMVLPVGVGEDQQLVVLEKTAHGLEKRVVFPVRFVPMTGEAERHGR